jgi:hypothetical protein
MGRLAFKLSLLLPLLIGMVWVNWTVDPAIIFPEHVADPARHAYENIVANDLLAGRPHRLKMTHLDLVVDELIFRGRPETDTLVLGSSISKPIHQGQFGSPAFFNASIPGGGINQMIMAYQLALDCGLHPRHVLIEVNCRSLGNSAMTPPPLLRKAYRRMGIPVEPERSWFWPALWRGLAPGEDPTDDRGAFYPYDEVISPRYFQFTMGVVARRWLARHEKPQEIASQFGEPNESLLYPDGSFEWWANGLLHTPETVHADYNALNKVPIIADSLRPDAATCRLYEAFVADLLQSGAEPVLILLPPNPYFYERAEQEWQGTGKKLSSVEVEAFFRSLGAKHHLRVLGCLDPRRVGLKETDYIDNVHIRREVIGRLLKPVGSGDGEQPK